MHRVGVIMAELAEATVPLSLTDLTHRTGLPKTTVHRLLASMCDAGLVRRAGAGFLLALAAPRVGVPARPSFALPRRWYLPHLVELYERTHQMVGLGVLVGDEVEFIERIYGPDRLDDGAEDVDRLPAALTAAGRVLLAFAQAERPLRPGTATAGAGLARSLADIRRRRIAVHADASDAGAFRAAAPVTDRAGRVVAAVEIGGGGCPGVCVTMLVEQVRRTAHALTAAARCLN
ncbi:MULTISPECIES: IclR family transcriptional regulator [Streptomyces]|uniref:IclR family transcriptional regulator n=1 Tax=Streptomyces TaxID=1883 RepID=UPI001966A56B|nr:MULTISPECIES: helix-turn-helix domain-containing protein [Streptomyces]QRX90628.1 helix-turn-helix domain-containing protein [Streptomyces noursei]UJB40555.1 helix-turn-helix domain-containing protein [Streptomyces sp. A1-5]